MTFSDRFQEVRTGFERAFWVANLTEIFERLSYYGTFASLALYLQERLNFSTEQTGTLAGIFGGWCGFSPFGGAAADRLGFRRALSAAYLILAFRLLSARLNKRVVAGVGPECRPPGHVRGVHSHVPPVGVALVKALRGRHNFAGFEGERSDDWLFDLLHDGEYWRRFLALSCVVGASPSRGRERLSRRRD